MFFDYNGTRVWYGQQGEGPDLLLLHGWGCTHTVWDSFVGPLSKSRRVTVLDFPGFGESDEPSDVWGVYEYTAMVEAFCASLGIVRPSLAGHSFGGRVSIVFASRNPVDRVMLVDAAGIKPKRSVRDYLKVYSYKVSKWFLLRVLHSQAAFEKMRSGKGSADYAAASPRMKAVLSKTVNQDLRGLLPSISVPVILFWGTADTATPLADARLMDSLLPDSGLIMVPGGTHFAFLEDPRKFLSVADNFFARGPVEK